LPNAQSAVAAFLGKDSEHNAGGIFPGDLLNTSQKAELGAGMLALTVATKIKQVTMTDLSQVVIKTDSDYLAKAMTEWVFKWKKNGYRTAKGLPVTNRALFEWLDNSVRSLNEMGVRVLFWHVTRDRNREADRLANDFLDGKIERSV
jgi:ribonuclease HI